MDIRVDILDLMDDELSAVRTLGQSDDFEAV